MGNVIKQMKQRREIINAHIEEVQIIVSSIEATTERIKEKMIEIERKVM